MTRASDAPTVATVFNVVSNEGKDAILISNSDKANDFVWDEVIYAFSFGAEEISIYNSEVPEVSIETPELTL